jgi:tetratricopeptide (TPR) repeat protein
MFYGRDALVAELTNLVVNDEHIALVGPGGMGKSSIAKAIINEPLVTEKFGDRRFFVTYDGLDPSTMTFETFMTRFAVALGTELVGSDPLHQLSKFLHSATALIVLDNAETFEEASGSLALEKIPPAIADIADIPGVILILTSRSRRNAPNVPWITKDVPPLDLPSARTAFFRIYRRANPSDDGEEIDILLNELEFHSLSINLLANAAQQNNWSPPILLKRWNDRHSKVLDHGRGKLQSLSFTMQLSLGSPSIQNLGEDGRRVLAVIAFLPQGLNESLASDLLPSIPQVDAICDVLCMQSLVYRQGSFIKMLAPIRRYVQDSLPPPDTTCLQDIRDFYNDCVQQCSEEQKHYADIIISDSLNIEHVVAFDPAQVPGDTSEIDVISTFLWCLICHQPRPTTLAPAIFNIVENSSTWTLKAHCLWHLGELYNSLCQPAEAMKAFQAAEVLYLTAGNHTWAAECVITCAANYSRQGRFIQAKQVLEDLQGSDSWKYLSKTMEAGVWFCLDQARMHTLAVSADKLFVKTIEDGVWDLMSQIGHWQAKLYSGGDIVQVKMHLEDLLQRARTGDPEDSRLPLHVLAQLAVCEDRLSDAMDILQNIIEMYEQYPYRVDWYTVFKGVVASKQRNYDLARELIHKTAEFALPSTDIYIHRSYASACVELAAEEYDRAESYFIATIEGCDVQSELMFKAFSVRGLGEVAFANGDFALAAHHFVQIRSLCAEMGMPPQHLNSCEPFLTLSERFEGWAVFLEGRSPFETVM